MRKTDVIMSMAQRLAQRGEFERLARLLGEIPPADTAQVLADLPLDDAVKIFSHMATELAADVLAELPDDLRRQLLDRLEPEQIAQVVEEMPSDEATDVLQDMEPEDAREVMADLDPDTRADITELASYSEDTAGGIMAKEFAAVPASATAGLAIQLLRRNFRDVEDLNVVFAVDEEDRLVGSCSLRDLVLASPDTLVSDLVASHEHWVQSQQDQEEVAHYMRLHDLDAVPVVDEHRRILGQITLDDAAEVMDEEAAEDLQKITGITAEEPVFGPLLPSLVRRLPWLLINTPLALLAASVARAFGDTVATVPHLVAYLPVLGGIAGNAAGQTIAVFVRGLALGEVTFADMGRALFAQGRIGLIAGAILGTLMLGISSLWEGNLHLAAVVGVALMLNCLVACLVGAFLPLLLRRVGWDPAMGANLVTTSITDACGYALLLGIATMVLRYGWLLN